MPFLFLPPALSLLALLFYVDTTQGGTATGKLIVALLFLACAALVLASFDPPSSP